MEAKRLFFAYRLPRASGIRTGEGKCEVGFRSENAFLIHKYDKNSEGCSIIAENEFPVLELGKYAERDMKVASDFSYPVATDREAHRKNVETVKDAIKRGDFQKAIVWKTIVFRQKVDVSATFMNLCEAYPDAYIYCFSDPEGGIWMGACPEVLLKTDGDEVFSMSLAGTRQALSTEDWDYKNLEEQGIVTRYIVEQFHKNGFSPEISDTETLPAGPVEHLCTWIRSPRGGKSNSELLSFACRLSPTPAVAGSGTRKDAEEREYYSGFSGPVNSDGEISLFVNLRIMKIHSDHFVLYSGGGITSLSNPDEEWEETERKAATLLSLIKRKQ
ncbi:MAG: hypothetical protein HDT02_04505 [Bacteroidales bacterium]|nr:hypothetical protein [Bacteroidales bacterium]